MLCVFGLGFAVAAFCPAWQVTFDYLGASEHVSRNDPIPACRADDQ